MIVLFSSKELPALSLVGGKALSLMRLTHAGYQVPSGFICTVEFFEPWLKRVKAIPEWKLLQYALNHDKSITESTKQLKSFCNTLTLNNIQQSKINQALKIFADNSLFAVRSSSPEEDLEGASFAGGYHTSLGVTEDSLLEALRQCFASAFDERVFSYKKQHGFSFKEPHIAIVIQKQINSECSGVGFSLNPLNNDYDEAVIDSNLGLGESVVSGKVTPDHFVISKISKEIIYKTLGKKEISIYLNKYGGVEKRVSKRLSEFSLNEKQVSEITDILCEIEGLYKHPVDIEWAYEDSKLYILQARPITAFIPLHSDMITEPSERRILYWDAGLTEGVTINKPMKPLTLDWMFASLGMWIEPYLGPVKIDGKGYPSKSFFFGRGGRFYVNLSQMAAVYSLKKLSKSNKPSSMDKLAGKLLANVNEEFYRATKKIDSLKWRNILKKAIQAVWYSRIFVRKTISAMRKPEFFHEKHYKPAIDKIVRDLKEIDYSNYTIRELIEKFNSDLTPVIAKAAMPALTPFAYYLDRLEKLFGDGTEENKQLIDSMLIGFEGNDAVEIGIQQFRMVKMLEARDFDDLDSLAERIKNRELPIDFLTVWDDFIYQYGYRGPGELELSNTRYGDDPRLALEQMSYMVHTDFNPIEKQKSQVTCRKEAFKKLSSKLTGKRLRKLRKIYRIVDLLAHTRDMPKYLWVLDNGIVRKRALLEGQKFVDQNRLDTKEDIFWLTLDEIDLANKDSTFDLRKACNVKKPFYKKLDEVIAFPHMIDSRGRIGQVKMPKEDNSIIKGFGISRGVSRGRIKVLNNPREKPIENGDILVAYTTDPGWTPLFVNAEAIILEIGGMLQHGGVVAREYGKPCVAGIQGITRLLKDGQLVEVNGTTGVIRILED